MHYEKGTRTTLYFDQGVLDELSSRAKSDGRSMSWLANSMIRSQMDGHEGLDREVSAKLKDRATLLGITEDRLINMAMRQFLGMIPGE